ncbi:MAG TPA: ABC transporter ATP-binding protein [Flavobacteriaceae bacterium]|nr:ABC transporter ATP-binding protein [Flavobacteriaceae bacterium]
MSPAIEIHNLYKKYPAAEDFSINDLSLTINPQEIFGLLGPNGAGKTTLLSMLCGLIQPTSGNFLILGDSYKNKRFSIKKRIGVVPQDIALYPTLTARENLRYFGSMYGLKGTQLSEKISEGLSFLGLEKFADKKINTFSGGMKRRVNLIAGTLHQPKVLFLDEPTVGVDVQSKNVIIDFLKKINQEGTTIIYTSHHLIEAQEFCTQIAIIENGKIYAQDTPEKLIHNTPGCKNLEEVFIALTGKELRDVI